MTNEQLFAFPHDNYVGDGGLDLEPNLFVPVEKGMAFEELRERWLEHAWAKLGPSGHCLYEKRTELENEFVQNVAGFFVFEKSAFETAMGVFPKDGVGSDSALYRLQSAAKRVLGSLSELVKAPHRR